MVVSNGAKHALHNAFTVLLNPGDEVIIPAPYWVSYAELVKLTGATPVIVATAEEDQFKLTPEHASPGRSPPRPSCCCCAARRIRPAACTRPRNLAGWPTWCLRRICWWLPTRFTSGWSTAIIASPASPRCGRACSERTVLINGVSKTYAMTGWRIGWTMAPANVARAMADLQSQETSNPCSVSQYAALAAINGPQDCVDAMLAEFAKRRDFVQRRIAAIPGLSCTEIAGAFYAFVNIQQHLGRAYGGKQVNNSTAVVPGAVGPAGRGHGDGLGLRRRGLRAAVVCHQHGHAGSGDGPDRAVCGVERRKRCQEPLFGVAAPWKWFLPPFFTHLFHSPVKSESAWPRAGSGAHSQRRNARCKCFRLINRSGLKSRTFRLPSPTQLWRTTVFFKSSLFSELKAVLDGLRRSHGDHPTLIETEADFCDVPPLQVELYRRAIRLAEANDLPTLSIRLSLAAVLLDDFHDRAHAAQELRACKPELATGADKSQLEEWFALTGRTEMSKPYTSPTLKLRSLM